MMKTLWTALLLSATAVFSAPVLAQPYPPDLDLSASVWQILNNGATLHNDASGGLYFDFPAVQPNAGCLGPPITCTNVNYLTTTHVPTAISGMISITLRVDASDPPPSFEDTSTGSCGNTTVRAFFRSQGGGNNSRWWSNPISYTLTSGTVTMNIPIDSDIWSNVVGDFGYENPNQWANAIDDVIELGVTFGNSGCAFGHGVFVVGGTARFTIENYEVAPIPNCPAINPCNGTSCVDSTETGSTIFNLYQCVTAAGPLLKCTAPEQASQQVHVVSTNCQQGPCCTAFPPCVCFTCPSGSHLECRTP
jgi:hypothetical protein